MSFRSWDVCTDPAGQFHACMADGSILRIDGVPFPQRHGVLFPRIASNGSVTLVAYKQHDNGEISVQNATGAAWGLESSHGNQPVAIEEFEDTFAVEIAHYETATLWTFDEHGAVTSGPKWQDDNPNKGASGFLDWGIWTDLHRSVTVDTVNAGSQILTLPMRRGRYTVGQANVGPDQVAVFDHETRTLHTIWRGSTQLPPRLAANGAQLRVAISADNVDRLFTEADLQPFDTTFQAPPFSVDKMARPMAVGTFFSTKEAPGNMAIFERDINNTRLDWHGQLGAPLWTDAIRDLDLSLEEVIEMNRVLSIQNRVPLAIFVDGDWRDPAGLLPTDIRMVQAYRAKGEPIAQFETRCANNVISARPRNEPWMIVAGAFDRNGTLSEPEMAEAFVVYRRMFTGWTNCVGVVFFAWDRKAKDGRPNTVAYPWLKQYIAAFAEASPGLPDFTLPKPIDPPDPLDPGDPVPRPEEPTVPETTQQTHERLAVRIYGMTTFDRFIEEQRFDECVKAVRTIMDTLGRVPSEPEAVKATPIYAKTWSGNPELEAWAATRNAA